MAWLTIEDVLDTGLPRAYGKPLYEQKCSTLFEHVYENYPDRDANNYAQRVDPKRRKRVWCVIIAQTSRVSLP